MDNAAKNLEQQYFLVNQCQYELSWLVYEALVEMYEKDLWDVLVIIPKTRDLQEMVHEMRLYVGTPQFSPQFAKFKQELGKAVEKATDALNHGTPRRLSEIALEHHEFPELVRCELMIFEKKLRKEADPDGKIDAVLSLSKCFCAFLESIIEYSYIFDSDVKPMRLYAFLRHIKKRTDALGLPGLTCPYSDLEEES